MALSTPALKTEIVDAVEAATAQLSPSASADKFNKAVWEGVANAVIEHIINRANVSVNAGTCSVGGQAGTTNSTTGSIS